jgi:hypothetical protein
MRSKLYYEFGACMRDTRITIIDISTYHVRAQTNLVRLA